MITRDGHIESRIQQRNESNPSLAEQLMLEAGGSLSDLSPGESAGGEEEASKGSGKKSELPVCWACNGKGVSEGLFSKSECFNCEGTGFDLAEPVAIIKKQNEWLEWAKETIIAQRRENAELKKLDTRTDGEKEAAAIEVFYKDSKMNRHD